MIKGPLKLIELTRRAYIFSENYKTSGIEGFSTGAVSETYNSLIEALDDFALEDLEIDLGKVELPYPAHEVKIAKIYRNKNLNIGLMFIPKGW